LATANGQVYYENTFPLDGKWSYKMQASADDKKYSTDTRKYSDAVVQDGIFPSFTNSPITDMCQIKDICYYKPGDLNKNGKEGRTSWDSFSYALLMGHNVWMHITAVQEANRRFDAGEYPSMMRRQVTGERFEDIVEAVFAAPTRQDSELIIDSYENYWTEIIGGRGRLGKKARHVTNGIFDILFEYAEPELNEDKLTELEAQ
jgi:hypothetical protein